jgi:hypothetical protein
VQPLRRSGAMRRRVRGRVREHERDGRQAFGCSAQRRQRGRRQDISGRREHAKRRGSTQHLSEPLHFRHALFELTQRVIQRKGGGRGRGGGQSGTRHAHWAKRRLHSDQLSTHRVQRLTHCIDARLHSARRVTIRALCVCIAHSRRGGSRGGGGGDRRRGSAGSCRGSGKKRCGFGPLKARSRLAARSGERAGGARRNQPVLLDVRHEKSECQPNCMPLSDRIVNMRKLGQTKQKEAECCWAGALP